MLNLGSKPLITHSLQSANFKTYLIGKHVNIAMKIAPRWVLLAPTRNYRLSVKRWLRYDLRTKTLNINVLPTFAFCAADWITYCFYSICTKYPAWAQPAFFALSRPHACRHPQVVTIFYFYETYFYGCYQYALNKNKARQENRIMSIQVWSKNLKKHYPNVNVEKVTVGERGKGYIVYVDGERMALNHFFRRFYRHRLDKEWRFTLNSTQGKPLRNLVIKSNFAFIITLNN